MSECKSSGNNYISTSNCFRAIIVFKFILCLRVSTFRHFLLAPHQMGRCTEFGIMEDDILSYDTKLFHALASCPGSVEHTTVDSFGKFWTSWSDLACIQNNEPEGIAGRLQCSVSIYPAVKRRCIYESFWM